MQIILNDEEKQIIIEAMITELQDTKEQLQIITEAIITELQDTKEQLRFDDGMGIKLSVKLNKEYIEKIKALLKRFGVENEIE